MPDLYFKLSYTATQVNQAISSVVSFNGSDVKSYIDDLHKDVQHYSGYSSMGIRGYPELFESTNYSIYTDGLKIKFEIANGIFDFPDGLVENSYKLKNITLTGNIFLEYTNDIGYMSTGQSRYVMLCYKNDSEQPLPLSSDGKSFSLTDNNSGYIKLTPNYYCNGDYLNYNNQKKSNSLYYYDLTTNSSYSINGNTYNMNPVICLGYFTKISSSQLSWTPWKGFITVSHCVIDNLRLRLNNLENNSITV